MEKNNSKLNKLEKYWILYDVGNSAFVLLMSTIIPIYYKNMASAEGISLANSTAYYSYAISISTIIVAVLGPILGTMADNKGYKKPFFTFSMIMGVLICASLSISTTVIMFLALFVIGKIVFSMSLIFYDSMLVDVTTDDRVDEVSSKGYAWGYIGSCIPFIVSLLLILKADAIGISTFIATAIAFVLNGLWWLITTIPLVKNYKQIHYVERSNNSILSSLSRLLNIFKEIKNDRKIFIFLISFFFYIDGVYTIIEMATSYGKDVGITDNSMLMALLLTQVVAFPFAILFGKLSKKFKVKDLISICILAYLLIALFALQLDTAIEFWILATFVGVFQGAIQALSRSYYAKIIPKEKSSEYFGVYDVFGKGASFVGTMIMGLSTQIFGNSKAGVVGIAIMFVLGFILFRVQGKSVRSLEAECV